MSQKPQLPRSTEIRVAAAVIIAAAYGVHQAQPEPRDWRMTAIPLAIVGTIVSIYFFMTRNKK